MTTEKTHKICGFRDKVKVCNFKAEDCTPEKCDMYNIDFTAKSILAHSKQLQEKLREITPKVEKVAETQGKSSEEYKKLRAVQADIAYGMAYMSKAYMWCKRRGI